MRYSKWIHLTSRELLFNRLQFLSFSTEGWFSFSSPFLPHSFPFTTITLTIHLFHHILHIPTHFIVVFNSIPFLHSIHSFYLHSLYSFHPSHHIIHPILETHTTHPISQQHPITFFHTVDMMKDQYERYVTRFPSTEPYNPPLRMGGMEGEWTIAHTRLDESIWSIAFHISCYILIVYRKWIFHCDDERVKDILCCVRTHC